MRLLLWVTRVRCICGAHIAVLSLGEWFFCDVGVRCLLLVEGFCARARQGYWSLLCFSAFEIKMMLEKEFGKISSLSVVSDNFRRIGISCFWKFWLNLAVKTSGLGFSVFGGLCYCLTPNCWSFLDLRDSVGRWIVFRSLSISCGFPVCWHTAVVIVDLLCYCDVPVASPFSSLILLIWILLLFWVIWAKDILIFSPKTSS